MKNICIIGDIHDWHSKQITSELRKKKFRVFKCSFKDIQIKINNSKKLIIIKKKYIKLSGVWVRFISAGSLEEITFKLSVLHILKDIGVYVHNSASTIEKTVDKFRTSSILKLNNFSVPETKIFLNKNDFINNTLRSFKKKKALLLKPLFGSQGKGIKILKNYKEIMEIFPSGGVYYLQNFIGNINKKKFTDIRVLMSGHKVISCIQRTSSNAITNFSQGSSVKKIEISKKLSQDCKLISKLFKLGYGGIDIKINNNETFILEINSIPSWKGVQSVENRNITEILVGQFIKFIKNDDSKKL